MSDNLKFRPLRMHGGPGGGGPTPGQPFDLSSLQAIGTVAKCDVDDSPTANTLPHISMKITQFVRLSDESLVRLDMDRGVTSVHHGAADGDGIFWKRPLDEVIKEVLDLVRADDEDDPTAHPWDELAEAARKRGVHVDAETLSGLPYQVVLSADTVATFVL